MAAKTTADPLPLTDQQRLAIAWAQADPSDGADAVLAAVEVARQAWLVLCETRAFLSSLSDSVHDRLLARVGSQELADRAADVQQLLADVDSLIDAHSDSLRSWCYATVLGGDAGEFEADLRHAILARSGATSPIAVQALGLERVQELTTVWTAA